MHERQAVIFGVLLAVLALAGLGGVAVYTGALDVPGLSRGFSTPPPDPNSTFAIPCPPEGAAPVPYSQVTVTVANSTARTGLAAATKSALEARGFQVGAPTSSKAAVAASARLVFGVSGVAAAYTVAAQIKDPEMVLDARAGTTVDVIVGTAYSGLIPADSITLDPTVAFAAPAGCVPIEQMTPVPEAVTPSPAASPSESPATDATPAG